MANMVQGKEVIVTWYKNSKGVYYNLDKYRIIFVKKGKTNWGGNPGWCIVGESLGVYDVIEDGYSSEEDAHLVLISIIN